ncbi:MAG: TylF/MycF/NovP-related O-methyltransferase [Acidimicrobiales bacterium]
MAARRHAVTAVRRSVARPVRAGLRRFGYDIVRRAGTSGSGTGTRAAFPPDFDADTIALIETVQPYTLTGPERIAALCDATRYVVTGGVPGAIVECGVWRGGSMMAVALTLLECGHTDRELYLFDTFGWVPRPSERDVGIDGRSALEEWERYDRDGLAAVDPHYHYWPLEDVRRILVATGYPEDHLHFVRGDVLDTVPEHAPEEIALLRLDTDYYESTAHELRHLEPRVSDRGVVLIDDYGHFSGARDAVDEHYAARGEPVLLQRIDYTARLVLVRRTR